MTARRSGLLCASLLSGIAFTGESAAIDIAVQGSWTAPTITEAYLVAGAGTDITPVESATAQVLIRITGAGAGSWTIKVSQSSTPALPAHTKLFVRRTSSNGDVSDVNGLGVYQQITTTPADFLTGTGNHNNANDDIELQFKLEASVLDPINSYTITVTYEIT